MDVLKLVAELVLVKSSTKALANADALTPAIAHLVRLEMPSLANVDALKPVAVLVLVKSSTKQLVNADAQTPTIALLVRLGILSLANVFVP